MISIHAPVKGATRKRWEMIRDGIDFNPRTREGCDIRDGRQYEMQHHFNPRTREGCDDRYGRAPEADIRFQSTHP